MRAEELPSEEGRKVYTVYLKAPETVRFINPFKVSASYLSYIKETGELPVSMGILVDNPGDVWAKKAVFHVYNETALVDIKLQRQQGDVWTDVTTEPSGSYSLVAKGLDSGTPLKLRAVKGEEYSNSVDITTEEELQVPNAGFEEWSVRQTWTSESFGGKKYMHIIHTLMLIVNGGILVMRLQLRKWEELIIHGIMRYTQELYLLMRRNCIQPHGCLEEQMRHIQEV